MKFLAFFTLITGYASAGHISMTFRGLDANYTFTPFAVSTLREIIACRTGLNHSMVLLDSIKIRNMTFEFSQEDEVNGPFRLIPYNCHFINTVHWNNNPSLISRSLLRELKEEIDITFRLQFPGASEKAYGANIIPFLSATVNEYYANILENNYIAFYAGSIPELVHQHHTIGIFREMDQMIIFYMFIVQIGIVVLGNYFMNRMKKRVIPLQHKIDIITV